MVGERGRNTGRGDWLRARRPFTQELGHELSFLHWVAAGVVWRELWRLLVGEEVRVEVGEFGGVALTGGGLGETPVIRRTATAD